MVRTIDGKEIENMKTAISPYTHLKIHFLKKSKFILELYLALNQNLFLIKFMN